jgi:MFS family permease
VFLQHRSIQTLLLTATLHSLVASSFVLLLPVVAKQILQVGPAELGWLWAANGAGMFAATAWLAWARQGTPRERLRLVAGAMTVAGFGACGLGLFAAPLVVAALAFVIGGGLALFVPIVWGLLQEWAPAHMLGRVFTMFSTGAMFTTMVGMLGFGWAVDALGARTSLAVIGLILFATALVAGGFSRSIGQEGAC